MNYREPDDETSLRARMAKVEGRLDAAESAWRTTVWAGWRRLGWALLIAFAAAALLGPLGWFCLRGTTWGTEARLNAEREALRWGRFYWPTLTAAWVYCPATLAGESVCVVRFPDSTTWTISCDDDSPAHNDGCENPKWKRPAEEAPSLTTAAQKRDAGTSR